MGDYVCNDIKEFKVYYRQLRHMACDQKIHDQIQQTKQTIDHVVILEELSPYSEYYIEVKAIKQRKRQRGKPFEKKIGQGYTLGAVPEIVLKEYNMEESIAEATSTSLTFSWSSPTDCKLYNSPLGYFYYQLTGDHQKESEYLSIDQTKITIDGLEPFTNYELRVYVTNEEKEYSNEHALVFSQATKGSKPPPPTDLFVSIDNDEFVISWKSPDPPKGSLSQYLLRWKEEISSWQPPVTLQHSISCPETAIECSTILRKIDTNKNYTFQIRATNEGVSEPSSWSHAFHHLRTEEESLLDSGVVIIIALVVIVCLLLLIIVVIVVIWRCRRNKFDRVLQYEPDWPPPYLDRKDTARDTTRTTRTELSVISVSSDDSGVASNKHNQNTGKDTNPYKVVDIVFPDKDSINTPSNRRSFHDRPLPPRPGEQEPIYTELPDKDKDSEEVYLAPKVASMESLDDDGYLRPNYKPKLEEDLEEDNEEYLKPNFHRPERINTQDMSPDREFRPAIPITSYSSNDCLDSTNAPKMPKVLQSSV